MIVLLLYSVRSLFKAAVYPWTCSVQKKAVLFHSLVI